MSKIHEALRKAEQLRVEERPAVDVLSEIGPSQLLEEEALGPNSGVGSVESGMVFSVEALGSALLNMECDPSEWNPDFRRILFKIPKGLEGIEHEQFRTLRSRLYQMRGTGNVKKILITSAVPAEGKTFVASNLAQVLVQQHEHRALLIDADLRQPRLHRYFGTPLTPGVSEYLRGQCNELDIIRRSPFGNLFLAAAGAEVGNAGDLVANGRFRTFLEQVTPVFDWVIVDSPPVVRISDAVLLAESCDGVILVVRANATSFEAVQKARDEFRQTPVLGVVLNGIQEQQLYNTYYPVPQNKKRTE
jgi:capsular exopolysaccharide synthesis family protein